MTRALLCSASIAAVAAAFPAFAQEAPDPDVAGTAGATAVTELVVTADRSPRPVASIGSAVTVLDQGDLKAIQSPDLVEILAETPSVTFSRNGGPGTVAGVSIRGGESYQTLLIIDGVRMNDPSAPQGGANFGNLLVGDVSRIEVLRGAQSTLWGSQAVGGVVNVVTAEPKSAFAGDVDLEGGSRGTVYARAAVGGATDRVVWRLAGGYYRTDGFSAWRYGTEADGYENKGLSGRVRVDLTDDVSVEARAVWSDGEAEFDGFGTDSAEYGVTKELAAYAGINFALLDGRLKNRLGYAHSETDRTNYDPGGFAPVSFDGDGETRRWEYQGSLAISARWTAVFGAEHEESEMTSASPWSADRGATGVDSLFGQLQVEAASGLFLTAGLRQDDHDAYGDKTLGSVSGAWSLNGGATVLRASWAQGFRAPGLYELFSEYGNAALSPEEFDSWEAGIEQRLSDAVTVSATVFRRTADNEIRFYSCAFGTTEPLCNPGGTFRFGYYDNIQKTETRGVELTGRATFDRLSLEGNYSWIDATVDGGANDGNTLARRPEHLANLTATWRWTDRVDTALAVRYVGETFTSEANTTTVDAYTLVDLRASWRVTDEVELYGRVENLFDEDYQTVIDYGTPGRGAFVGVRTRF